MPPIVGQPLWGEESMDWWIPLTASLLICLLVILRRRHGKRPRVWLMLAGMIVGGGIGAAVPTVTGLLFAGATARAEASMPPIRELWKQQPQRMADALGALQTPVPGRMNVYAIAVAAQGSQHIFSREAQLALQVAAARFGGSYRGGLLLSNGIADLASHPLATPDSLTMAVRAIGARIDPARDLVVVYLTSHGSPEAWISTDLPSKAAFPPISSASLAEALAKGGVKRRVVIVSACFAASWIPALASDDTIVIAAAAKDRTSFGCDDRRRLTYFGEAFLDDPLVRSASLKDAFQAARGTVAKWEAGQGVTPSLPEASVGRNMRKLWAARSVVR